MTTIKNLKRRLNLTLDLRNQVPISGDQSYQTWLHYHVLANKYQNQIDKLHKFCDTLGMP